jgi:hypothetical protein
MKRKRIEANDFVNEAIIEGTKRTNMTGPKNETPLYEFSCVSNICKIKIRDVIGVEISLRASKGKTKTVRSKCDDCEKLVSADPQDNLQQEVEFYTIDGGADKRSP